MHCFPFITLFAIYSLCGFNLKPNSCKVVVNNSYHNSSDFTHPYSAFKSLTCITFLPLFKHTNFKYALFTLRIMSTVSPSILNTVKLSIYAHKCVPFTSTAKFLFSQTPINNDIIRVSVEIVGDTVLSLEYKSCCGISSATVFPSNFTYLFSFMRLMARSACYFY